MPYTGIAGISQATGTHTKFDLEFDPTSFRKILKAPRPDVIQEGNKTAAGKDLYNFDLKRQLNDVSYRVLNNIEQTHS